ncbi:hypothetical protein MLD38_030950 [Melastoma candidum]|uniref:Uncharacterized protein n=1 Tax=Melastoma candidum TaxID=119954 RepID=A0ACB9MT92_9MYRT|nr:hypothetical protein MLD38_030950 [Melastoma candidum]
MTPGYTSLSDRPLRREVIIKTPFQRYFVKFSHFHPILLVVAIAQNFGILGNDRLHVLSLSGSAEPAPITSLFPSTPLTASTTSPGSNPTTPSSSPPSPTTLRTFLEQSYSIYSVIWHPRHADVFASASGDRTVRIWDVRDPNSTLVVPAHDHEILTCDWNKYDECVLATWSVDRNIRVWDL